MLEPCRIRDGHIFPEYFGPQDLPWLRAVLEQHAAAVGLPRRWLKERWREPLAVAAPEPKRKLMTEVLDRLTRDRDATKLSPRLVRSTLFTERAARIGTDREVLAATAKKLGVKPPELEQALFADLPGERIVPPLPPEWTPAELIPLANLELVQKLLRRSTHCRVQLRGATRSIVRSAIRRGLLCTVEGRAGRDEVVLGISGPLSVIHHTTLYGRALAGLVPLLTWCGFFHLRARCFLRGQGLVLEVRSGDALLPGKEPRRYDSKLEERFAVDFARLCPEWDLVREPEPVPVGRRLIFPDFALRHRSDPARRWLLEIAGFWTPQYLEEKLRALRLARFNNLIVCLDADRACGENEIPAASRVLRFRKRIDASQVRRIIEEGSENALVRS